MTRVLVTGGGGQLGREFALLLGPDAAAPGRDELDVADEESVAEAFARHRPELVLHCAAWTDVDGAESDPDGAWRVNEYGSRHVARAARACGAGLVGFSTDYVFAGDDPHGYDEESPVGPHSVYGASKLAGERALLTEHPDAHVVRTAWVFSPRGHNFLLTMLRLGAERDELRVVDDQVGCPTATPHLARATLELAEPLPTRRLPPRGWRIDELVGICGRDHAGGRAGERASRRSLRASCSDPPRDPPARSCGPSTPTPRGCHTGGTGCATVSPPWRTRRERETHPRNRRLRVHRLAFRAASAAARDDVEVVNLDALTYAGNPANLADVADHERYRFVHGSICDADAVASAAEGCDAIVNFAAETHVDRSIMEAGDFIQTDVFGTYLLLEWVRDRGGRLVHVSTDEVYGDIEAGYASREDDALRPSSPYSASKAGGDLQVLAAVRTYGVDAAITRGSNNYGPNQYPEKLIPLFTTNLLDGEPVPVYGDGRQSRDFIYVEDHCAGIETVLERGASGEVYNVGGGNEIENLTTTNAPARAHRAATRATSATSPTAPGHDRRYALDTSKLQGLGWRPEVTFDEGLQPHRGVVSRQPQLVGADQERRRLRRVPAQAVRQRRPLTRVGAARPVHGH